MAKVFTITPGLENMGAMKTGGQGSVYKGRRIGEIITAIKLLPTPIYSESEDDKNYKDFQNEVNKLKKVNEEPNPNVVKILSSGLSETGNFPYIEMEYIEGPDLEDLLQPPHDKIFTIKEVIKVAEHLSYAIAHCHKKDIRHGDIKSNNVKYNVHSGNYVLLDFGLAIMTDEQRRTSLRKAGAVEFMAPEQNEGQMLFETDVYSFGIIIFELLAGTVPFPLESKSETARNNVRLAHLETLPPDLLLLRREAIPSEWPEDKKDRELKVPEWLVNMVYKCLKKKPANRFANGMELHDYVVHNGINTLKNVASSSYRATTEPAVNSFSTASQTQEQLQLVREKLESKEKELDRLKALLRTRDGEVEELQAAAPQYQSEPGDRGVSKTWFIALLLLTIAFASFSAYTLIKKPVTKDLATTSASEDNNISDDIPETVPTTEETVALPPDEDAEATRKAEALRKKQVADSINQVEKAKAAALQSKNVSVDSNDEDVSNEQDNQQTTTQDTEKPKNKSVQYMVIAKAYFYNGTDESSRRAAFIEPSNENIVTPIEEKNGFIYVSFLNRDGQTVTGWIRKKDLQQINE